MFFESGRDSQSELTHGEYGNVGYSSLYVYIYICVIWGLGF